MYARFIYEEGNNMKNQTEIKLPVGVVETTNPEIDQRNNPDKMRDFSYKRISFSVGCSINGWYEMKLEIPVEIFDEAFYDSDADCPNREFMNIVNWKYSHKHGCHQYDAEIFCPTGHPSSDCTVYREIWLEYNGLEDKPMTWDEYTAQFGEFVFNASWEDVIVAIRHELNVRESVRTRYLNGDYEIWLQQDVTFNEWNTESLINEAVRIIDDILKYVNHESKESVQTVDEGPITSFRGEYAFLSNFHSCEIRLEIFQNSYVFNNAEAAFQAYKCDRPDDIVQFTNMNGPQAKRVGRKVRLRHDWEYIKDSIMEYVVSAKFYQNKDLCDKLLATGNRELIECNTWNDTYWGVCDGKGQNKLGKILMKVRDDCRRRY